MQINQSNLSIFFIFIGQIILFSNRVHADPLFEKSVFYMNDLNTSRIVRKILSNNWMENNECLNELSAIERGLDNREPWAVKGMLDYEFN